MASIMEAASLEASPVDLKSSRQTSIVRNTKAGLTRKRISFGLKNNGRISFRGIECTGYRSRIGTGAGLSFLSFC
jgi:hypothetical protein